MILSAVAGLIAGLLLRKVEPRHAAADGPAPTPLTREDRAVMADAYREVGVPPNMAGQPWQTLRVLRIVPRDTAERMVEHFVLRQAEAARCWEQAHAAQLDHYRRLLAATQDAHGCHLHGHTPRAPEARA